MNKADISLTVHRPDPKTFQTEIFVRKVRFKHIGRIGSQLMRWDKDSGRYEVA